MAGSLKNEQRKKGRSQAKLEVFTNEIGGSPNADRHHSGEKRVFVKEFLYKNLDFIALTIMGLLLLGIMIGLII